MEKNTNLVIHAMAFDKDEIQIEVGHSGIFEKSEIFKENMIINLNDAVLNGSVLNSNGHNCKVSYDEEAFKKAREYREKVVKNQEKDRNEDTPTK